MISSEHELQVQMSSYNFNSESDVINLLNNAKQLGTLEGIYSVIGTGQNVHESLFTYLDLNSRRLFPELRYFVVVNIGNSMSGHSTCISRVNHELPSTLVSLPEVTDANYTSWHGALDIIECALCTSRIAIIARVTPKENSTLLARIAAIGGITLTEDINMQSTLEELGVSDEKMQLISMLLRATYNFNFYENQLLHLTLEDILHLEQTDDTIDDIKGLSKFFSQVDPDELQASTEMIFKPTITSGSYLRDNEFDMTQPFISIVPGMEGLHERFSAICERLKLSALVLQPSLEHLNETVHDIAKKFTEALMRRTAIKDNFYILGYESGIFIALEMARILEENGLTGTVYCIGFAPDELKATVEETLAQYKTEEEIQNAIILHMLSLMTAEDTTELTISLPNTSTWQQKLEVCMRFLKGRVPHSRQYAMALIESALIRIEQTRLYNIKEHPLRSRLILLRAATSHTPPTETSLQKYSQQPVIIHQMRAPLAHVTKDPRCAAIINQYLDPKILDAFEKKNICDTYLLSPNSFMSIQQDY